MQVAHRAAPESFVTHLLGNLLSRTVCQLAACRARCGTTLMLTPICYARELGWCRGGLAAAFREN